MYPVRGDRVHASDASLRCLCIVTHNHNRFAVRLTIDISSSVGACVTCITPVCTAEFDVAH